MGGINAKRWVVTKCTLRHVTQTTHVDILLKTTNGGLARITTNVQAAIQTGKISMISSAIPQPMTIHFKKGDDGVDFQSIPVPMDEI